MDITYIHGLEIQTIIGIFDWEREKKQTLIIDLDIFSNFSQVILSDHIDDCIDYTRVCEKIELLAEQHSYQLIESFAEDISQIVLEQFNSQSVKIKINKPMAIKNAASTGVIIERFKKKDNTK
ncbi:MAG: dihydroneopterin aldolase [Pseudomonadota bacterium]